MMTQTLHSTPPAELDVRTWDRVASYYAVRPGIGEQLTRHFAPEFLDQLDLGLFVSRASPVRVLDVAAGTGVVSIQIAKRLGSEAYIVAADFSAGMLKRCAAKCIEADVRTVACVRCDGQDLVFPDAHFDVAVSQFGLVFFPNPLRGLEELYRVLIPGGTVGIASYVSKERSTINAVASLGMEALHRQLPTGHKEKMELVFSQYSSGLFFYGDTDKFKAHLESAGFTDVKFHFSSYSWISTPESAVRYALSGPATEDWRKELEALSPDYLPQFEACLCSVAGSYFNQEDLGSQVRFHLDAVFGIAKKA